MNTRFESWPNRYASASILAADSALLLERSARTSHSSKVTTRPWKRSA